MPVSPINQMKPALNILVVPQGPAAVTLTMILLSDLSKDSETGTCRVTETIPFGTRTMNQETTCILDHAIC